MPPPWPEYLDNTLDDRGDGFFFSSTPPAGLSDRSNLTSSDPWTVLGCTLSRAQSGELSDFEPLMEALGMTHDGIYWNMAELLLAFAAPYSQLRSLKRLFPDAMLMAFPEVVRRYSEILAHSLAPWAIDEVLRWYEATPDENVRVTVTDYLSHCLEDQPATVDKGPRRKMAPLPPPPFEEYYYDYEEYIAEVRRIRDEVLRNCGGTLETPLLGGKSFSVVELAHRILRHAREGEDSTRTNFERMAFEGATGIPCKDFFDPSRDHDFNPLAAAAIVEDFVQSPAAQKFKPGVRYFFGHPIPP
jgi:hypothetical protein